MPRKCSMMSYDDVVCGVITIDAGSSEEAERQARVMRRCPKCLAVGTTGSSVIGVYLAPREGRWWLDYPSLFPDRRSSVQIMENVVYPEALTVEPSEAVPCGATCEGCPFAERYGCRGCLAVSGITG
ncbi:MAG TPA: hypothetical protein VMW22_05010 [Candidatus Desulfaltia sp.]|nr:hypothetical protein [Candidatus Desulfaltia sp.]